MAPPGLAAQGCWQMPCYILLKGLQKLTWTSGHHSHCIMYDLVEILQLLVLAWG